MKEEIILIRYPEGEMTLVLPKALEKTSVPNLRKIFKHVLKNAHWHPENEEHLSKLEAFLTEHRAELKPDVYELVKDRKRFEKADKLLTAYKTLKAKYYTR